MTAEIHKVSTRNLRSQFSACAQWTGARGGNPKIALKSKDPKAFSHILTRHTRPVSTCARMDMNYCYRPWIRCIDTGRGLPCCKQAATSNSRLDPDKNDPLSGNTDRERKEQAGKTDQTWSIA
jgi:hypothetical protein